MHSRVAYPYPGPEIRKMKKTSVLYNAYVPATRAHHYNSGRSDSYNSTNNTHISGQGRWRHGRKREEHNTPSLFLLHLPGKTRHYCCTTLTLLTPMTTTTTTTTSTLNRKQRPKRHSRTTKALSTAASRTPRRLTFVQSSQRQKVKSI